MNYSQYVRMFQKLRLEIDYYISERVKNNELIQTQNIKDKLEKYLRLKKFWDFFNEFPKQIYLQNHIEIICDAITNVSYPEISISANPKTVYNIDGTKKIVIEFGWKNKNGDERVTDLEIAKAKDCFSQPVCKLISVEKASNWFGLGSKAELNYKNKVFEIALDSFRQKNPDFNL